MSFPSLSLSLSLWCIFSLSLFEVHFHPSLSVQRVSSVSLHLSNSFLCLFALFLRSSVSPTRARACVRVPVRRYVAQVCAHTREACRTSPWRHGEGPTMNTRSSRFPGSAPGATNVRHDVDLLNAALLGEIERERRSSLRHVVSIRTYVHVHPYNTG